MSIKIEIFGEDFSQTLSELRGFAGPLMSTTSPAAVLSHDEPAMVGTGHETGATTANAAEPPKRRGRPPKNPEAAPVAETAPAAAEPPKAAEPAPAPQPDPVVAAQDEADEQAETEATKPAEATLDDVRRAMKAYADKFGMEAAQSDLREVWSKAGVVAAKLSEIATPDACATAAAAIDLATKNNAFGRDLAKAA